MHTTTTKTARADALAASLAQAAPSAPGLDDIEFEDLSAVGRIDALLACELAARHTQALVVRALAVLDQATQAERGHRRGNTEAEISAALNWPAATVHNRLAEAGLLAARFPETLAHLDAGVVSWAQAKALVEITSCLDETAARAVQDRVLPRMPTQSAPVTRQALHRAVHAVDPDGAAQRHATARKRRRIELRPEQDGMATLSLFTPAETARAILNNLTIHCRTKTKNDPRTLDQRRADLCAALLLGAKPSEGLNASQDPEVPVRVNLIVNIETLMGLTDAPGHLEGYGPISAAQARTLAVGRTARWRRMIVTPTGKPLHIDPRTRRPSAALRREIEAHNPVCDFPACQMPAHRCDLDHETPYDAGGPTDEHNLRPRCRKHHNLKTHGLWGTGHLDETAIWTSIETGRSYTNTPEPYYVITDDDLKERFGDWNDDDPDDE